VSRWSELRRDLALARATARDLRPPPPSAFGSFGEGSWIVPPARVSTPSSIHVGRDVVVLEHSWLSVVPAIDGVTPRLAIGDGSRIGRFVHIACVGEIVIGPALYAAERIFIADTYHRYQDPDVPVQDQPMAEPRPVHIGAEVFLGVASIVLAGVTIGDGAYVGAGAVEIDDVPPGMVVVGNPARVIRKR
jgi:acetyltransferase-like isoleucine patch superfamily enzyme